MTDQISSRRKRRARGVSARRRKGSSRPKHFDPKNALLLLRPGPEAYKCANSTLARIVQARSEADVPVIDKVLFKLSCRLSVSTLAGYSTLDVNHIAEIHALSTKIKQYAADTSQKRPLNFLMLASPGSGKSHFIRCVAQSLQANNVMALTYDLTALEKNDDLIPSLEAARNQKVIDKIPLLFLDEFDSRPGNIPMLLPLLWDGAINLGRHDLKLGKIVIILAGSDSHLPDAMEKAKSMRRELDFDEEKINPKIVDLLSRINGGTVVIPPFHDSNRKIDRRPDKICAAIHLLGRRFGKELKMIPIGLLRFIHDTEFRYGVRSINHLIDLIPFRENIDRLEYSDLKLPMDNANDLVDSSLAYHLIQDDEDAAVIVNSWHAARSVKIWLPIFHEDDEFIPSWVPVEQYKTMGSELIDTLCAEIASFHN